jgi:hypothetical protein
MLFHLRLALHISSIMRTKPRRSSTRKSERPAETTTNGSVWADVRPVKRYGRFTPLRVEKENTTLICNTLYAIYFKLDVVVGMERMDDPEGFVIKILMGCS